MHIRTSALVVVAALTSTVAAAQDRPGPQLVSGIDVPSWEFGAGIAFADFDRDRLEQQTFPDFGLAIWLALNATSHAALVGELSRYAEYTSQPLRRAERNQVDGVMGGARVATSFLRMGTGPGASWLRGFGQVLAGTRTSDIGLGGPALQYGGGIDVHVRPGISVRAELDECVVFRSGAGLSGGRFLLGLVFGPG